MLRFLTERRRNRMKEQIILSKLNDEFKRNKDILNRQLALMEENEKSCLKLMELINKSDEELRLHNVDNLLFWSVEYRSFTPSQNALPALMQSERIFFITDTQLRAKIFEWEHEREKNTTSFMAYEKYVEDKIFGYLLKRIPFKKKDRQGVTDWKTGTGSEDDPYTLWYNKEYENLLARKVYYITMLKEEYRVLGNIINTIIERTEL